MSDEKKKDNTGAYVAGGAVGGLLGGVGAYTAGAKALAGEIDGATSHRNKVFQDMSWAVHANDFVTPLEALVENHGYSPEDGEKVLQAFDRNNLKTATAADKELIEGLSTRLTDEKLGGFAKIITKHPIKVTAGGAAVGIAAGLGIAAAVLNRKKDEPKKSHAETVDARRDAAAAREKGL